MVMLLLGGGIVAFLVVYVPLVRRALSHRRARTPLPIAWYRIVIELYRDGRIAKSTDLLVDPFGPLRPERSPGVLYGAAAFFAIARTAALGPGSVPPAPESVSDAEGAATAFLAAIANRDTAGAAMLWSALDEGALLQVTWAVLTSVPSAITDETLDKVEEAFAGSTLGAPRFSPLAERPVPQLHVPSFTRTARRRHAS
ncbi:MAG: hypothetical protein M0014_12240 [Actinomycetota bacterium]|jgi:hypothetical protein|nr:hypothetical protein [Actinomycetota bacterium]